VGGNGWKHRSTPPGGRPARGACHRRSSSCWCDSGWFIYRGTIQAQTEKRRGRSLELRASGPKEMTDNCFELCLQLTQILFHHHHSCPRPAHCTGTAPAGRTRPSLRTKYVYYPPCTAARVHTRASTYIHTSTWYTLCLLVCPCCHACLNYWRSINVNTLAL